MLNKINNLEKVSITIDNWDNLIGEKEFSVRETPTFQDFMGYMYYCGGSISGPFFEYHDFIEFIELKGRYSKIPSTIVPTLSRLSIAVCKIDKYYI